MNIINQNDTINSESESNITLPNNSHQAQPINIVNQIMDEQIIPQFNLFQYNIQEKSVVLHLNQKISINKRLLKTNRRKYKKSLNRHNLLKIIAQQDLSDLF
ncbi:unnamed protein product [Paramecium sonneborni]|uniref:Uncharacterized protein n=1 Tax=Paramecium sonneborni TaxID=65129 RepID=A0A8S1QSM2_9CILI|nr:unnamed protein product [Paramecium sonneborni]